MSLSRKVGECLFVLAAVVATKSFAGECAEKTSNSYVTHELRTERNLICIIRGGEGAEIYLYEGGGAGRLISRNEALLSEFDRVEDIVRLEPSGNGFQIYFEYPSNVYLVAFDADALHVKRSAVSVRMTSVSSLVPSQVFSLVMSSSYLGGLDFRSISYGEIFDRGFLILENRFETYITAESSQISTSPNDLGLTGVFLKVGQRVEVLAFSDGWMKVRYEVAGISGSVGWVQMADIL
jgi:hypothetical protein